MDYDFLLLVIALIAFLIYLLKNPDTFSFFEKPTKLKAFLVWINIFNISIFLYYYDIVKENFEVFLGTL